MEQPIYLKKIYADESPYPTTVVGFPNRNDGIAMLDNVGGNHSEMTTIAMYIYNNFSLSEFNEIAQDFIKIAMVEMHHLKIFADLAAGCGEDPRLWTRRSNRSILWSPSYVKYSSSISILLNNAIEGEEGAIKKYESQIQYAKDAIVISNLKRVILDEKIHVAIFKDLFNRYST